MPRHVDINLLKYVKLGDQPSAEQWNMIVDLLKRQVTGAHVTSSADGWQVRARPRGLPPVLLVRVTSASETVLMCQEVQMTGFGTGMFEDAPGEPFEAAVWPGQAGADYEEKQNIVMAALLVDETAGSYVVLLSGDRIYGTWEDATCEDCSGGS
jgi:hypothetical protein